MLFFGPTYRFTCRTLDESAFTLRSSGRETLSRSHVGELLLDFRQWSIFPVDLIAIYQLEAGFTRE